MEGILNSSKISDVKCTEKDMQIILKYLKVSSAKEAEILNKNLIERAGISEKWDTIKWKLKNYCSTDWLNSTGAGCLDLICYVLCEVMEMNPQHYHRNKIYRAKTQSRPDVNVGNTVDLINLNAAKKMPPVLRTSEKAATLRPVDVEVCFSAYNEVLAIKGNRMNFYSPSVSLQSQSCKSAELPKKAKESAEKNKKKSNPKISLTSLAAFQAERSQMLKKKFEWERRQHEREMDMIEKKLAIEENWIKTEMDLNRKELELIEKEMEREEKLRILDMEKEERLRKYELELQYQSHC